MKLQSIFTLLLIFIMASCAEDSSVFENVEAEESSNSTQIKDDTKQNSNARLSNYILAAVVAGNNCAVGQRQYTVYATAGQTKSFERQVNVIITRNNSLLEQKFVRIAPYQRQSPNVVVFSNATEQYGNVDVIIHEVFSNGINVTNDYELRNTTNNVQNCYFGNPSGGPGPDFCNGNDADGDGICDGIDPDGDGDGIPDSHDGLGFN